MGSLSFLKVPITLGKRKSLRQKLIFELTVRYNLKN